MRKKSAEVHRGHAHWCYADEILLARWCYAEEKKIKSVEHKPLTRSGVKWSVTFLFLCLPKTKDQKTKRNMNGLLTIVGTTRLERKSGPIGQGKPTQTMRLENEAAKSTGKQMFEIQLWQILRPMSFNDEWQISHRNLGLNNRSHFKRNKGNHDATTVLHKTKQNGTNKKRKKQLKTVGPQLAPEPSLRMMGWQGKIHHKPIEHVMFVILSGAVCSLELCVFCAIS